ncbi:hypothetical protein PSAB6_230394 [Paraburkholderia sabiae]|nr:hypothetical protein PSAB6_230394 [Paraburkholderia sabiae]
MLTAVTSSKRNATQRNATQRNATQRNATQSDVIFIHWQFYLFYMKH